MSSNAYLLCTICTSNWWCLNCMKHFDTRIYQPIFNDNLPHAHQLAVRFGTIEVALLKTLEIEMFLSSSDTNHSGLPSYLVNIAINFVQLDWTIQIIGFLVQCAVHSACIFAASISYFEPNFLSIWSYFEPNSLSIRSQNGCGFWRPFFVRIIESYTIVKRIPKWPLKIIIYFGLQSGSMNWFTWWYFRQSYGTRLHWLLAGVCSWWRASVPGSQDISIKGRKKALLYCTFIFTLRLG